MKTVETVFKPHDPEKRDSDTQAERKACEVDERVQPVLLQAPVSGFEVVPDHISRQVTVETGHSGTLFKNSLPIKRGRQKRPLYADIEEV